MCLNFLLGIQPQPARQNLCPWSGGGLEAYITIGAGRYFKETHTLPKMISTEKTGSRRWGGEWGGVEVEVEIGFFGEVTWKRPATEVTCQAEENTVQNLSNQLGMPKLQEELWSGWGQVWEGS